MVGLLLQGVWGSLVALEMAQPGPWCKHAWQRQDHGAASWCKP